MTIDNNINNLITLQNKRLKVDVAQPGAIYNGFRFDWTGHVIQVKLDGIHTFCGMESLIKGVGTGGIGLCNEFGMVKPIIPSAQESGKQFPKLGIGLLTPLSKGKQDYSSPCKLERFPITVEQGETQLKFTAGPLECKGVAARLSKTLSISNQSLVIHYTLENTGTLPIETDEYNHNFLCVDNNSIGPDYTLSFPYRLSLDEAIGEVGDIFAINRDSLTWRQTAEKDFYGIFKGFENAQNHYWELIHQPTGLGIRESCDFPVERIAIWGRNHVVSPEFFIGINLLPGKTMEWTRTYSFFSKNN